MYKIYNSVWQIVLHKQQQLSYNAEITEKKKPHVSGLLTINIKRKLEWAAWFSFHTLKLSNSYSKTKYLRPSHTRNSTPEVS